MPGPAEDVIRRFWEVETDQRYSTLVELFTDDAVFCDPLYGRMDGKAAIAEFMGLMEQVVPARDVTFELVDCAGGTTCAWSRWVMRAPGPDGTLVDVPGQSLYRLRDGRICFDADYIDPLAYRQLRPTADRQPNLAAAAGAGAHLAPPESTPVPAALAAVRRFWQIQDERRYGELAELFAPDAVFEDLIYGRFEGHAAVTGYLQRMETEMPAYGITFTLVDLAGDETTAWSQLTTNFPNGTVPGWTLHRVRDGMITLDADFFDTAAAAALQPQR
jgi:ketosteroid isomerase-like protein